MDADEEDCIFFGTPIGREEDTSARKRKAAADAGALRALPAWKQEVRDDEGRRRFHGAFTGGFSAGYYNTAGSKEGWTPQTFTSSRKNRGEVKQQSIYNFLDEDEREEFGGCALETSSKFDTFGFTAAELSRKEAVKDQKKRPSIIPGPVPDEIVLPAANSVGIKLLLRMGWRHGRSISDARTSLYDSRREARKAFLAFSGNKENQSEYHEPEFEISGEDLEHEINASQNIPVYVLNPKQNLHGLGYDPFKHAPEFRERKRLHSSRTSDVGPVSKASRKGNLFSLNSGKIAPGFGIGALEELDIEDEDIYDDGFEITETCEDEIELPPRLKKDVKLLSLGKESAVLTGFKVATSSDYKLERFQPPNIPRNFELHHNFSAPLDASIRSMDSPPPEAAPPDDNNLRLLIEGFAALVSRCGQLFEDLSREKNKSNPLFIFLNGGKGHDYYSRKLWEEQQKRVDQKRMLVDMNSRSSVQKMTVETRGRALGEKPLVKSSNSSTSTVSAPEVNVQSNLSDNFTKTSSHFEISEIGKPFEKDPAKQQRFEQFLKDKFEGGLRSVSFSGTNSWSENDRARERLDFEAALEVVKKGKSDGKQNEISLQLITDVTRFVSGGTEITGQPQKEEQRSAKDYPKREEFQWRPAPILCKRFDIMDPFMGKPPMPRVKSKMDSFIFASDFVKSEKIEETAVAVKGSSLSSDLNETAELIASTELKPDLNHKSVHKPVDLYKAIFSDDSEDDDEYENKKQSETLEKKSDGANTTLNRLVAGDFLESLGKELGLDIPSEAAPPPTNVHAHKEVDVGEDPKITPDYHKLASTSKTALNTEHISKNGKTVVSTLEGDDSDYVKKLSGDRKTISPARDRSRDVGHGTAKTEKEPTYFHSTGNRTQTHHQGSSSSSDTDSSPDQRSQKRRRHSNKKDKKAHSSKGEKIRSKHHHGGTSSRRHSSRDNGHSDSESPTDGKIHGGSRHKSRSSKKEGKRHSRHHIHRHRKSSTSPSDTEVDDHCSRDRHDRITSGSHERSSRSGGHRKHY